MVNRDAGEQAKLMSGRESMPESLGGQSTGPVVMQVYHGTRQSSAANIVRHGFRPTSVSDQIAKVAADHRTSETAIRADLTEQGRFAVSDPERHDRISVTGNEERAGSWAQRAPEATWEALWSVYRIRHPELGYNWNQSEEGHLWVAAHQMHDPPVVITIEVSLHSLQNPNRRLNAAEMLAQCHADGDSERFWRIADLMVEWRIELNAECDIVQACEVPVRIAPSLACFMSGETEESFTAQVTEGKWGRPIHVPSRFETWYPFDQIWSRLPESRQAELEMIIGAPLH